MTIIYGNFYDVMYDKINCESIDHLITDPPFGIELKSNQSSYNRKDDNVIGGYIEWSKEDYFSNMNALLSSAARVCKSTANIIIFSSWNNLPIFFKAFNNRWIKDIYNYQGNIVWKYQFGVRNNSIITGHYHIHWLTFRTNKKPIFNRDCRYPPISEENKRLSYADRYSVWNIKKKYRRNVRKYTTELPSELCDKLIQYFTNEGDIVLDPFAGAGNIAVAAKKYERLPLSIELNHEVIPYLMHKVYGKSIFEGWPTSKIKSYLEKNPIQHSKQLEDRQCLIL